MLSVWFLNQRLIVSLWFLNQRNGMEIWFENLMRLYDKGIDGKTVWYIGATDCRCSDGV